MSPLSQSTLSLSLPLSLSIILQIEIQDDDGKGADTDGFDLLSHSLGLYFGLAMVAWRAMARPDLARGLGTGSPRP